MDPHPDPVPDPDRSGAPSHAAGPGHDGADGPACPADRVGMVEQLAAELEDRNLVGEFPNAVASVIPAEIRPSKHQLIDALVAADQRQRAAEIEQVALVSCLCDAYSALEPNPGGDVDDAARVLFGEQLLLPSFDGTTPVAEFLGHELGPALGISPDSAWALVWDVLALRHRHPILWNHVLVGKVRVWLARKVAAACTRLPAEQARELDSQLGPSLVGWGPVKTMTEVHRVRAELDPEAEEKRQAARASRQVTFTPDRHTDGLTFLEGTLDAFDATQLKATINRLAATLQKGGATGSMDELRAAALGHLAHPDRAARLLQPDLWDAGAVVGEDGHLINAATGEVVTRTASGGDTAARCHHGAEVVIRLGARAFTRGAGGTVDGIGPVTAAQLHEYFASCGGTVVVRPFVDLAEPLSVSTYRPSAEMVWRLKLRDEREMFPYSNRSATSTRVDQDHTRSHHQGGKTCMTNLGPLARRTHRLKTHAAFTVSQDTPGTFKWTTPLGRTYWTSARGTFTEPPPVVVTNDPDQTTATVLAHLLRVTAATQTAAATNQAGANQASGSQASANQADADMGQATTQPDPTAQPTSTDDPLF